MTESQILLIADGLHAAYAPALQSVLAEDRLSLVVASPVLASLNDLAERADQLVRAHEPDIACFGCCPWANEPVGDELLPLPTHERALLRAAEAIRRWCGRQVVYVTTPPLDPARFGTGGPREQDAAAALNRTITQHNQLAAGLMGELNIAVADLHHQIEREGPSCLADNGFSLSAAGIQIAAQVVAKGIYGVLRA